MVVDHMGKPWKLAPISPLYLPYISATSPLYLRGARGGGPHGQALEARPYISPISPMYLRYISLISPRCPWWWTTWASLGSSPLYLPYISHVSPLYLPYISEVPVVVDHLGKPWKLAADGGPNPSP